MHQKSMWGQSRFMSIPETHQTRPKVPSPVRGGIEVSCDFGGISPRYRGRTFTGLLPGAMELRIVKFIGMKMTQRKKLSL